MSSNQPQHSKPLTGEASAPGSENIAPVTAHHKPNPNDVMARIAAAKALLNKSAQAPKSVSAEYTDFPLDAAPAPTVEPIAKEPVVEVPIVAPDRAEIDATIARWNAHNGQRMQRILDTLSSQQAEFLPLLPLLFHYNLQQLPGYVAPDTPCGVACYIPSNDARRIAARILRNPTFQFPKAPANPIHGLYVMGSVGTVAYTKSSDLDFWLCHEPSLTTEELASLAEKAKAIEIWADTINLEVHFFFINAEQFRAGIGCPVSKESTGSIQHHLLLDEFYRSALYVAGRIPLWWLVPPDYEYSYSRYINSLAEKGLVAEEECIDFGGMESMPADEFLAASLWHLYKAIGSPHKSLLKLLLLEAYASEYPIVEWVSTQMKRAVYNEELDGNSLDPYILMYRKVEQYLTKIGESERLELGRQCFYIKANASLSQDSAAKSTQQRRNIVRSIIEPWNWDQEHLVLIDSRRRRMLLSLIDERKEIIRGLRGCYQSICQFASKIVKSTTYDNHEVSLIGRLLFAALEKKPGKVEIFSADHEKGVEENEFSLHEVRQTGDASVWNLHIGMVRAVDARGKVPVKKGNSLLEVLVWMVANGVYDSDCSSTHLVVEASRTLLPPQDLNRVMKLLVNLIAHNVHEGESLDVFCVPPKVTHVCMFLNLGQEHAVTRNATQAVANNRSDPLCYGINQSHLMVTTEQVSLTSWHEVIVRKYEGVEGFFECLCDIYNQTGELPVKPDTQIHCLIPTRGEIIVRRIQELYDNFWKVLGETQDSPSYVIRGERSLYMLNRRDGVLSLNKMSSNEQLIQEMTAYSSVYRPVLFDAAAWEGSPLPAICDLNQKDVVQVFAMSDKQNVEVYILDERGVLYIQRFPGLQIGRMQLQRIFNPYGAYLDAIKKRCASSFTVEYYWVTKQADGSGFTVDKTPYSVRAMTKKIDVRIMAKEMAPGRIAYKIFINDKDFMAQDNIPELFKRAADQVSQFRQAGGEHPIYISDINVPPAALGVETPAQLQSAVFLKYRDKIEAMLNAGSATETVA